MSIISIIKSSIKSRRIIDLFLPCEICNRQIKMLYQPSLIKILYIAV